MTLRKEIEQAIRWELSKEPLAQRMFRAGDEPLQQISPGEYFAFYRAHSAALQAAVFRLADEIDTLRERGGAE